MKSNRGILLPFALLALLATSACGADKEQGAGYGEIVRYAKNRDVTFPNFTMRYLGERRVVSPIFKPGFTYHDFEVHSRKSTQTVSWSSGTGEIDAVSFQVDGQAYALELRRSVLKKGWLKEDEMVVWPQAKYREALEQRSQAR